MRISLSGMHNPLKYAGVVTSAPGPQWGLAFWTNDSAIFIQDHLLAMSDIHCVEDLQELSAKQMKDMLAMNRVNFKGVVEKQELFKIVERVWRQHVKSTEEKDTLEDEDMCKICMDNRVDCVMLECGHMCPCLQCGKQLSECPICRAYVIRVVKIF